MSIKYKGQDVKAIYWKDQEIVRRYIKDEIVYQKTPVDVSKRFRFKNVSGEPNVIRLTKSNTAAPTVKLEKSSNGINYSPCDIYAGIELAPDETVYLRGRNTSFGDNNPHYNSFTSTGNVECHGSIMDLCDNGTGTTTIISNRQFESLFYKMSTLITPPDLPATTLTTYCYDSMFYGCSSLTTAPELPAMRLERCCYALMFSDCTSLTVAPELPATSLAPYCYSTMFSGCTSLTVAPKVLPAKTLYERSYFQMFSTCRSLEVAPKILATELGFACCYGMFGWCKLRVAPELLATKLAEFCYSNMFQQCYSLIQAPELPATQLANYCYREMFDGCTSLERAPELPATQLMTQCYDGMFAWCGKLNYVKVGATVWDTDCSKHWLYEVSPTGTFIKPKELQIGNEPGQIPLNDSYGIPAGWKVEEV